MLWLHEKAGYNFFNIPRLTYKEINTLLGAKKRQMKREEKEQKKADRKSKTGRGRFK